MLLFRLTEYARAEAKFVHNTVDALSRSRGGIIAQIRREPASRTGSSQITTDEGVTVEFEPIEVSAPITVSREDIVAGRTDSLLASLDKAAELQHEQLTKLVLSSLEAVTEATGNQVDASGKSHFEYLYETYDKVELTFEADGSISPGFTWVMNPETAEVMKQRDAEMTADEQRQLAELIDRKRREYFAGRRSRKLS